MSVPNPPNIISATTNTNETSLTVIWSITGPTPDSYSFKVVGGADNITYGFIATTSPASIDITTGGYTKGITHTLTMRARIGLTVSGISNTVTIIVGPPPCFLPLTRILTPAGYRAVETLCDYDDVETSDGRIVPVKVFRTHMAKTTQDTAPYCIPRGAIAHNIPDEDLHVSGLHAIQDSTGTWQFPVTFGVPHLPGKPATYYHLECPNYFTDNIIANNTVAESFRNRQGREGITFEYCEDRKGFVRNKEDEIKDASEIPSDVLAVYC